MKIVAWNVVGSDDRIYGQTDTKKEATALRKELRAANPDMTFELEPVR